MLQLMMKALTACLQALLLLPGQRQLQLLQHHQRSRRHFYCYPQWCCCRAVAAADSQLQQCHPLCRSCSCGGWYMGWQTVALMTA
jgi:hypothetical protein